MIAQICTGCSHFACLCRPLTTSLVIPGDTMTYPLYLFNQTIEQLREIGGRGGRASARNRRARMRAALPSQPAPLPHPVHTETAAEAIAALNAQFPWLRGAEKRLRSHQCRLASPPQRVAR